MGGEDALGEGLLVFGGPEGGVEAFVVDESDGFAGGEDGMVGVGGELEGDGGVGEYGEGVDAVFGDGDAEEGDEHAALAFDLPHGGGDGAGAAVAGLGPGGGGRVAGEGAGPVLGFDDEYGGGGDDEVVDLEAFVADAEVEVVEEQVVVG